MPEGNVSSPLLFRLHCSGGRPIMPDRSPTRVRLAQNLRGRGGARDAFNRHPQDFKIVGLGHKGHVCERANAALHCVNAFSRRYDDWKGGVELTKLADELLARAV